jgi:MoaA/NifB/PqqE/SkfB family radical SAM enzyme
LELLELNNEINKSINNLLKSLIKFSIKNPSQALFLSKTATAQRKAAKRRLENERLGLHVPAFMIASITQRCNLRCKGCYSHVHSANRKIESELNFDKMKSMVEEARDLGISMVLLAGGEPLVRKEEVFKIAKGCKDVIFPIFTNGLLIDNPMIDIFKNLKNAIPIISIEGFEEETDERRGIGVYKNLKKLFEQLKQGGVFYGVSITVASNNIDKITDEKFVNELIEGGCKLFFYTEYVPVEFGTEELVLNDIERELLMQRMDLLRENHPAFFIAFPGDEKSFGGCIASGRGFIHISPEGNVEPCPFAPYSDSNIKDKTLKECIQSDFLRKIRENHELLVESQGGCALWEKKELVQSFLK